MNAWAKRGLKAAFFTGGMLVLGAGIASANECCPDRPTSPLSPSVSVPVHLCDNVLGAPGGPHDLPCVSEHITTDELLAAIPDDDAMTQGDDLRGNAGRANVVVPVVVAGNAIAVTENAAAGGSSEFVHHRHDPIYTDGADGPLAGNVFAGDVVVPLVATGNAAGVLADAYSDADSTTEVSSGGDVYTSGDNGPFAGNILAPMFAVPFQASGNGVGLGGTGEATGRHSLSTASGGELGTTGRDNAGSGNVLAGAFAVPFQANGNGLAAAGRGLSSAEDITVTSAGGDIVSNGDPAQGSGNIVAPSLAGPARLAGNAIAGPGQAETSGSGDSRNTAGGDHGTSGADSVASGNIVDPAVALPAQGLANAVAGGGDAASTYVDSTTSTAGGQHSTDGRNGVATGGVLAAPVAGPAQLAGNAIAGAGTAQTDTRSASITRAAGGSATNGDDSLAGGTVADTPVSMPLMGFGNAAAGAGTADARHTSGTTATTGGESYTLGDGSLLGGTMASSPVGGPAELFGNAVAAGADATADGRNTAATRAGDFQGTRGSDSVAAGNLAQAPVAVPFQLMGNAAGGAGTADGSASNVKITEVGGPPTTNDDAGVLASNVVHPAVSGPFEFFGNAAGGAAEVESNVDSTSDITAGGPVTATGTGGVGSGNVAHGPFAMPTQAFGQVVTLAARGESTTSNDSTSTAGGDVLSDGTDGLASGNVADAGMAGVSQSIGAVATGLGEADAAASNQTDALSGGSVDTAGTDGLGSGNVAQVPTVASPHPFGDAVAAAAEGDSAVLSDTILESGGDVTTDGGQGALSGNIASVPAGALAQAFAAAVAGPAGDADAEAANTTTGIAGGATETGGDGFLTGLDGQLPAGVVVQPHDVPVELLGEAETTASNDTTLVTGEAGPLVDLPLVGPGLPALGDRSPDRSPGSLDGSSERSQAGGLDLLDGLGLPAVGSLPSAPALSPGSMSAPEFPVVDGNTPLGGPLPLGDTLPTDVTPPGVVPVGSLVADNPLGALLAGLPLIGALLTDLPMGGELPTTELPIPELPADLPAELPTGLPAAELPLGGDAMGGTLPVAGDVLSGGVPVAGGVLDGGLPVTGDVLGGGMPTGDGPVGRIPFLGEVSGEVFGGLPMDRDQDGGVPVFGGVLGGMPSPELGGVTLPSTDGVSLPVVGAGVPTTEDLPLPSLPTTPEAPEAPTGRPVPLPTPVDLPAFDSIGGQDRLNSLTAGLPTD